MGLQIRKIEKFGMQRKIVANMTTESWEEIPHTGVLYEPDVTDFWNEWLKIKNEPGFEGISFNTVMLYACTCGFLAAPEMNAHINYTHRFVYGTITQYSNVDISMPTALPNGSMMTLNVKNCESKTLREITEYIEDLRRRMLNTNFDEVMFEVSMENTVRLLKKLKLPTIAGRLLGVLPSRSEIHRPKGADKKAYNAIPATERLTKLDMRQGTTLISNIGSIYRGAYNPATLIEIIPPMVTALCVGSICDKPGIVKQPGGGMTVEPRKFLPINICMDHRALDYDGVVPFCKRLDEIFANPADVRGWITHCPK